MLRRNVSLSLLPLVLVFALLNASPAVDQTRRLHTDYTVEVANPDSSVFHVTANVLDIDGPRVDFSLPVWTPGWYTIENYAKNILRFKITDDKGATLPYTRTRKQTWSVDTKGRHQLKVEFDYRATVMALNQAKITKDFAFFTGTELFLMAEGHRNSPSAVHFIIPAGWKIISALKETSDPLTFTAPDYDTLVDAPTELGHFDVTRFEIEGKAHFLVRTPVGAFSPDQAEKWTKIATRVVSTESALFGGLPYEKYVFFNLDVPVESNAGGGLEHLNSFVFAGGNPPPRDADFSSPEFAPSIAGGIAHEFFHLWNVKRIRPIEMWPYDYSRENETPLLWVSEGITDYYTDLMSYRAGVIDRNGFLDGVKRAASSVENNDARSYMSPAESSVSTWLCYDTRCAFNTNYYGQGKDLGALLDLSIRHDTEGRASLDDVMRGLYRDFYLHGKGFSTEDLIGVIDRLTKRDYHDFFRRYVSGVEVPDYDTILGYAGYRMEKKSIKRTVFGVDARIGAGDTLEITSIDVGSPAAAAGLAIHDVILKVQGGVDFRGIEKPEHKGSYFGWFRNENAGRTVKLTVKRGSEEKELTLTLGARDGFTYNLVEGAQPTPVQLQIREGWLAVTK